MYLDAKSDRKKWTLTLQHILNYHREKYNFKIIQNVEFKRFMFNTLVNYKITNLDIEITKHELLKRNK